MRNNIVKIIFFAGAAIFIIALYLLISLQSPSKPLAGKGDSLQGEAQIGGEFELIDQNREIFHSSNLKGRLSLIYFGFTYCPDICPTSLQKISNIITTLDKYQIDAVPVFVTIDPERDSSKMLKGYLAHFHPKFIGLTGSKEQIKQVADKFKVYYAKAAGAAGAQDYMIDHSAFIYLMDKDGKYLKHFYMSSTPHEVIEFIRIYKNQQLEN